MYENITYKTILQRMLDKIPNTLDKREGSVIFDALAPAAMELKLAYIEFDQILNESFADTASRSFLIRRCAERGIYPKESTKAVLLGEFTPSSLDVSGQKFSLGKLNYTVVSKIENGKYQVQCETAGVEGNQYLGTVIPIEYIDKLETAELTDVLIPGEEAESTEHLRQRFFNSFSSVAFGGNIADYKAKINSLDGVGGCKVQRITQDEPNIVITIIDSDYNVPSATLVERVQETTDPKEKSGEGVGFAPIDHQVLIKSVEAVAINITTDITYASGYTESSALPQIKAAIDNYLLSLCSEWENSDSLVVRISYLESNILNCAEVVDIQNTMINGLSKNIELSAYQIPIGGTVNGQ